MAASAILVRSGCGAMKHLELSEVTPLTLVGIDVPCANEERYRIQLVALIAPVLLVFQTYDGDGTHAIALHV